MVKVFHQNEINKVTDPFYRVDESRNRAKGGAGLGLSILEQIAHCHNAMLSIESLPNIGTIVKLTLRVHNKFIIIQ